MEVGYQSSYRYNRKDPSLIKQKILQKFSSYDVKKMYSYDELLFIFDQRCQLNRCDRDIVKGLFTQITDINGSVSLNDFIFKFVENLETSKLCIMRDQALVQEMNQKVDKLHLSNKAYVYLKIIQATVHARYSTTPVFSYQIYPSDIPPVTFINTLNPILNHQYTLQLRQNQFDIIFNESGITICTWRWPDQPNLKAGQYRRLVSNEGVSFELLIKYIPKGSNENKDRLNKQITTLQANLQTETEAFKNLCNFQPFLNQQIIRVKKIQQKGFWWKVTDVIIRCLPFMSSHVASLFKFLLVMILVECLACSSWPMQLLDITLIIYVIGILLDRSKIDIGIQLWISIFFLILLIVKSIWGAIMKSPAVPHYPIFLLLAIAFKIVAIMMIWLTAVRKQQYPIERDEYFYNKRSIKTLQNEEQYEKDYR